MGKSEGSDFNGLDTFKHVVVLMLENRSFDNLLGFLYKDPNFNKAGRLFNGLQDANIENPVPTDANGYTPGLTFKPMKAGDFSQPFPDPGEVYQHVNTQLYNVIDPPNVGVDQTRMVSPYNIPKPLPDPHNTMKGFVKDYINTLRGLWNEKIGPDSKSCWFERRKLRRQYGKYQNPTPDIYKAIMQCFEPTQVSALSKLASEFAVFDNWHCSVPSQTWCNRAFWHAGTSGGKVINPTDAAKGHLFNAAKSWIKDVWPQPTLFDRMHDKGVSAAVYGNSITALTRLIHGFSHHIEVISNDDDLKHFKEDINSSEPHALAQYSFIEPKFFGKHNDQHPSSVPSGPFENDGKTREGTVRLGEELIRDVYNSVKNSPRRDETLLIITHDEHGGCFDHVIPPSAIPPKPGAIGEKGFTFDRLGIRVPIVMIASSIDSPVIESDGYDHTSFIKTMCMKWKMPGLADRDKSP